MNYRLQVERQVPSQEYNPQLFTEQLRCAEFLGKGITGSVYGISETVALKIPLTKPTSDLVWALEFLHLRQYIIFPEQLTVISINQALQDMFWHQLYDQLTFNPVRIYPELEQYVIDEKGDIRGILMERIHGITHQDFLSNKSNYSISQSVIDKFLDDVWLSGPNSGYWNEELNGNNILYVVDNHEVMRMRMVDGSWDYVGKRMCRRKMNIRKQALEHALSSETLEDMDFSL